MMNSYVKCAKLLITLNLVFLSGIALAKPLKDSPTTSLRVCFAGACGPTDTKDSSIFKGSIICNNIKGVNPMPWVSTNLTTTACTIYAEKPGEQTNYRLGGFLISYRVTDKTFSIKPIGYEPLPITYESGYTYETQLKNGDMSAFAVYNADGSPMGSAGSYTSTKEIIVYPFQRSIPTESPSFKNKMK